MKEQSTQQRDISAPVVTVAMCTYNGERFLDAQIQSILAQTYPYFELIINDDGSSDQTLAIIRAWMAKDARVQLFQNKENLGYNRNFEKTITMGTGAYIAISDQDDLWHSGKLEKIMAAFNTPEVVLVHSAVASIRGTAISYHAARYLHLFEGSDPRPLFFRNHISGHAMVFRRSLLPHILPIPEQMYYDWWIATTAACNGTVKAVNECLVYHRLHEHNSYFGKKQEQKNAADDLLHNLKQFATISNLQKKDAAFIQQLYQLIARHRSEKPFFDTQLFRFFWKHRSIFFGYKKRMLPAITHFKYSLGHAFKQF